VAKQKFPVIIEQLPTTQCALCGQRLAYRPNEASAVLTRHYEREHSDNLEAALVGTR
jgi:hypothetical protein